LSQLLLAQQSKSVAVEPERLDSKAPSSLAFGSPREALYRGGGKNSLRSNNSRLYPLFSSSLGYAATGLKPKGCWKF